METIRKGDKVIYTGCTDEQVSWGAGNDDPRQLLVEGAIYFVEKIESHTWHTKLHLHGICGRFNSVSFKKL